jgi:hypothetical protein
MDPLVHKRFLEYRERYVYFGRTVRVLTSDEFAIADAEHRALAAQGDDRDDEEEERLVALARLLFRD